MKQTWDAFQWFYELDNETQNTIRTEADCGDDEDKLREYITDTYSGRFNNNIGKSSNTPTHILVPMEEFIDLLDTGLSGKMLAAGLKQNKSRFNDYKIDLSEDTVKEKAFTNSLKYAGVIQEEVYRKGYLKAIKDLLQSK